MFKVLLQSIFNNRLHGFIFACLAITLISAEAIARTINIPLNRAEVIRTGEVLGSVVVANPEIADVNVHGEDSVSIIATAIGTTSVRLANQDGDTLDEIDVIVSYDLPAIKKVIKTFFPETSINVRPVGTSIALSGFVPDGETALQVQKIVFEFIKENSEQISEQNEAGGPQETFPGIINLMRVNTGHQVMLKVRIGEIQRSTIKELGVNLQAVSEVGSSLFRFGTGSAVASGAGLIGQAFNITPGVGGGAPQITELTGLFGPNNQFQEFAATGTGFGSVGGFVRRGNSGLGGVLDMLESEGLFKVLAEPNIVAMSGESAKFLAGGQFAFPAEATDGVVAFDFKDFGIGVNFVPSVINPNRIRLAVAPTLSELNFDSGSDVPSLTTRSVETTVELAPGETFMIAGLIRDQLNAAIRELPGLSELPVISGLFRSTSYQRNETELVIAITPYLVDPIVGNEVKLPTDDYRAPSMMEMFFYGALSANSENADTYSQTPSFEGPIGYMVD